MPLGHAALAFLVSLSSSDPKAIAVIDTAIGRMGGLPALEGISRMRIEQMTEWHRTALDDRIATPVGSYERDTELRDYTIPAWRYTRRFIGPAATTQELIDVVADTAAVMFAAGAWRPLSGAYLQERDELFMATPDRILVLARKADDARVLADTAINGVKLARIGATIRRTPVTLHFEKATGMLAIVQLKAGQLWDFGLVPWGVMDVQFRYSRWSRNAQSGITLPTQTDIYRIGRPYKKVIWLAFQVNPAIPADSFAIADSLRAQYMATQNKAMHDIPLDTAKIVDNTFAVFGAPGTPTGAVKVGGQWVIFEGGAAPLTAQRSLDYLQKAEPATKVGLALLTSASGAVAGAAEYVKRGVPTQATAGARPYVAASFAGWSASPASIRTVDETKWTRVGNDSLRVASLDLPDAPRAAMVYVPSLKWLYVSTGAAVLQRDLMLADARRRGWAVEKIAGPGMPINGVAAPK